MRSWANDDSHISFDQWMKLGNKAAAEAAARSVDVRDTSISYPSHSEMFILSREAEARYCFKQANTLSTKPHSVSG